MKYIRVDEAPLSLKNNELVLVKPDFMEEIVATRGRRGVVKTASIRAIRDVLMAITEKYDKTINPYHLKLQHYENLMYDGDRGFSDLILKIIKELKLPLIERAIEFNLKNRKTSVDTVYYVSQDLEDTAAFTRMGFSMSKS